MKSNLKILVTLKILKMLLLNLIADHTLGLPIVALAIEKPRPRTQILRLFEAEERKNQKFRELRGTRVHVLYR